MDTLNINHIALQEQWDQNYIQIQQSIFLKGICFRASRINLLDLLSLYKLYFHFVDSGEHAVFWRGAWPVRHGEEQDVDHVQLPNHADGDEDREPRQDHVTWQAGHRSNIQLCI